MWSTISFLLLFQYLSTILADNSTDFVSSKATCTPDGCINNYVRIKIDELKRQILEEGADEPLYFPTKYSRRLTTIFSDSTIDFRMNQINFSDGVLSGLYPRLQIQSVTSAVLVGRIYVYVLSRQVVLSGTYNVSGTVFGNEVSTAGTYELYGQVEQSGYIYYTINSDGKINVTRDTFATYISWAASYFDNFILSGESIRPVLTRHYGETILSTVQTPLGVLTMKFKNAIISEFEDKSLAVLTNWEDPAPVLPTVPTIPTTTEPPIFACLPDNCIQQYYEKEVMFWGDFVDRNGLAQIPLNRTFSNRALTTTFDLDLTYTNVIIENFLVYTPSTYFSHNLAAGIFTLSRYPEISISGTFSANGTVLGEEVNHSGRWTGKIRHYLYYSYRYTLTNNFEFLQVTNNPSTSRSLSSAYDFTTDLFPALHPLKQPFDALVQAQLSNQYINTWVLDLTLYLVSYFNELLDRATFPNLITAQLPSTMTAVPTPTTARTTTSTTPPPPFQCEPNDCLLDYVKQKFSRFPDWVDSVDRDPLVIPGSHRVVFQIWDLELFLENITVYGYLPTFVNTQTTMTSDLLSGILTISTRSPLLAIEGKYNSSGILEEYDLTKNGMWNMNLSIWSELTLNYRIDSEGFISEIRDTFTTALQTRSGVVFENYIDLSEPLAPLLMDDIAQRASTLVASQIRTFTSLITDFMSILLTENKFYDIIVWHRYGNQTTDPPVICSRNAKSTVSLSNWYVPIFGHYPLSIRGSFFDILHSLECRFNDVLVTGTIESRSTAVCDIPYLYQTGRVPVQIVLQYANGCEQSFTEIITAAIPEDLNKSLYAQIESNGGLELVWDSDYFDNEELQLLVLQLDRDQATWVESGVLITSVTNTGSYSGLVENLNLLASLSSGFVLYLHSIPEPTITKNMYSKIVYTDYGKSAEYFASACLSWYEADNGPATNIEPCPPLLAQAWIDSRFEYEWNLQDYDDLQFYHPGGELSFRQLVPNSAGEGSQCVYKNGSLFIGSPGGGSADMASPNNRTGYINHHIQDIYPWYVCCGYSGDESLCRKHYEKRPSDPGTDYVPPPRPGNGEGDPHMTTFDGVSYTFNGIGEFHMIKTFNTIYSNKFEFQARMEQFKDVSTGEVRNASAFTAFAMRESSQTNETLVHLQISADEDGKSLSVSVNETVLEVPDDFPSHGGKPFILQVNDEGFVSVFFNKLGHFESVFVSLSTGFSFNISIIPNQKALNILSFASKVVRHEGYTGLLGSLDGIPENDLTYPGNALLPLNSSLREIHEQFGIYWRTTEAKSIFLYEFGKTHASYQRPDFQPNFEEPNLVDFPEALEICGQSKECLYDFVSTGNVDFAKETKRFQENFNNTGDIIEEIVIMCSVLEDLVDGWFEADNFIAGSTASFFCNPGFIISGNDTAKCGYDGFWESAEPICELGNGFDCSLKPDGYYPDRGDCSKYFGCLRGTMTERSCPNPLLFDSLRLTCVPRNSVVCAS